MNRAKRLVAMAVGAHPDDIEFTMAGTLLLLKQAGAEIHMWNLANGSCGSATHTRKDIVRLRTAEAAASAECAGAVLHAPLVHDLEIFYEHKLLRRVSAVIRDVKPDILLIPSPLDYMEDHSNTCRLIVTAAFVRAMPNYITDPPVESWMGETVLYHGMPHGLRDGMRTLIRSGQYVDVSTVMAAKRVMLSQHHTQKDWLDVSQGMDSYLHEMESMTRAVGKMSDVFEFAEGWRRHLHLGFSSAQTDPLSDILGAACWVDQTYEDSLNR